MTNLRKFAASTAMIAVAVTGFTPATTLAASVSHKPVEVHNSNGPIYEEANEYRRRYRRGYRYRRNRIGAGDVLAGIGILAGIAIIADAASKNNRRDRRRDRYEYPEQPRPQQTRGDDIGAAISACSEAAERSAGNDVRVGEINSATRDGEGWSVSGRLNNDRSFACGARNGQVDFIQLGDQ